MKNFAAGLIPRHAVAPTPPKGELAEKPEQGGAAQAKPPVASPPPDRTSVLNKGQRVQHDDGSAGKVQFYDKDRSRARLTMDDGSKRVSVKRGFLVPMKKEERGL